MRRNSQRRAGPGVLELIEEAVHLLRMSPLSVTGCYYLGSLPFALGLLYFWADTSRSSTAYEHCAQASFGVSALFLWMKTWQAIFAKRLKAQIAGGPAPTVTLANFSRVALIQTILQPSGLFLIPASLLILLPAGWVYAFYQNVTALGAEEGVEAKQVFKRAVKQAQLWPKQNHLLLAVLALFGFVVCFDLASGLAAIPSLLRTLFGVETTFTRSPWSFLNTTFLATIFSLTYLCLDPLLKAVYQLRCFYGESLHTGEDLKAELKLYVPATRAATLLILVTCLAGVANAASENPRAPVSDPQPAVAAPDLDRSIEQVLNRREYNWRLPREKPAEDVASRGVFASFMDGVIETLRGWAKWIGRAVKAAVLWIVKAADWLREKIFGKRSAHESGSRGMAWMVVPQVLILILLTIVACVVAVLFYRMWKRRGARKAVESTPVPSVPDLADENVSASELPEDDWLKLARELMGKGELRLALRALYLGSLAHLAYREMIRIARFKSNRDYELELRRRGRALPELHSAFAENVGIFERVWYGLHEVTQEALQRFQLNLEKIKAC